ASGAAMLPIHVCRWFRSIGLEIMEDYGQTETAGVLCLTERYVDSAGTVGKPADDTEFKIAADGEILTKGRHVFVGYYKDDAATAQVLVNGWLHTGDLGDITDRKLVRIRGRKKEIMKTSGGKMIAPLPIEEALKIAPIISQVCMVGDGRKFIAALITLSEAKLEEAKKADQLGDLITAPVIISEVKKYIDDLNASLAGYEQIKKFAILSREFSIEEGEMTPTLKMKRNVIETRFQSVIDQFYVSDYERTPRSNATLAL
ncbi:MAG: AMP-binding protein, partial [Bdellovibrionia bacterium]